ncbi:MAG TPA: methylcobamide--CoM methyltransferase [Dehalococcoidia bacterium]
MSILTTVVGAYPKIPNRPRPAKLRTAIARYEQGEIGDAELTAVQREVVREVIDEQIDAGVDLITDGLIRWEDDVTPFARAFAGFSIDGLVRYFDTNTYYRQPVVEGPVAWTRPVVVEEWKYAAAVSDRPVKAVVTGPYTMARLSLDRHYGRLEPLVLDLAEALHQELVALQAAGADYLQVNEPAVLQHPEDLPLLERALEVLTADLQQEVMLYTWFGSVAAVYPRILDLPVAVLGIDFVHDPQNLEVVRRAPFTKKLAYGIVDATNTRLETVDEIVERIRAMVDHVPPDRLYVNPSAGLEYLPRETAQAKLRRMVEGVRRAREVLS